MEKLKAYLETINLNDYDLGGVEITEEDLEMIYEEMQCGTSMKTAVDDHLYEIRRVLDEGLDDEIFDE